MKPEFTKFEYLADVVWDLDDFAQNPGNNCINYLMDQKLKFPNLKVTLFAIPFYENHSHKEFYDWINRTFGDWIQLAVHGWTHDTPRECAEWDYETAKKYITQAYAMGCFVKGFKAPGWQISRDTYRVLDELNFWVADHTVSAYTEPGILNKDRRPPTLKAYTVEHPWMCHGHTWDITNDNPAYRNGIRQIIEEHGVPWDTNTKFHFIEEVV